MKRELLEYIVRECINKILDEADTSSPSSPSSTANSTLSTSFPSSNVPPNNRMPLLPPNVQKGIWYFDPKNLSKPIKVALSHPTDNAKLERQLRVIAKSGGPTLKIAAATLRGVMASLNNPTLALYLYIGKQQENDSDLYLLSTKSPQIAKSNSVRVDPDTMEIPVSATSVTPSTSMAVEPSPSMGASKTTAPNITERVKLQLMMRKMIREALGKKS